MSGGLRYATGADAGSTNADLLSRAVDHGPHTTEIGIPAATGHVVGVADGVPVAGFFTAKFTSKCHLTYSRL